MGGGRNPHTILRPVFHKPEALYTHVSSVGCGTVKHTLIILGINRSVPRPPKLIISIECVQYVNLILMPFREIEGGTNVTAVVNVIILIIM